MSALVDTSIWSLSLRRRQGRSKKEDLFVDELGQLIASDQARIIGAIRQELLSGIRSPEQFTSLRDRMRSFIDLPVGSQDHEMAASFANACTAKGIQNSSIDMLICAIAVRYELAIFTTDTDFTHYQNHLPIRLHHAS